MFSLIIDWELFDKKKLNWNIQITGLLVELNESEWRFEIRNDTNNKHMKIYHTDMTDIYHRNLNLIYYWRIKIVIIIQQNKRYLTTVSSVKAHNCK